MWICRPLTPWNLQGPILPCRASPSSVLGEDTGASLQQATGVPVGGHPGLPPGCQANAWEKVQCSLGGDMRGLLRRNQVAHQRSCQSQAAALGLALERP